MFLVFGSLFSLVVGFLLLLISGVGSLEGLKFWGLFISLGLYILSIFEYCLFVFGIHYTSFIFLDSLSLYLVLLTSLLTVVCILSSLYVEYGVFFVGLYLVLEFFILGVFLVKDLFWFYVCYEGVLIPMYLLLGLGSYRVRRVKAGRYFVLYTLFGSLFMLVGLFIVYISVGTFNYDLILFSGLSIYSERLVWFLFFLGFYVKVPLFPLHIWLPEAHVEAPTSASILLAGVLLKLGIYGLFRYQCILFSGSVPYYRGFICLVGVVGVVYSGLIAIRQIDLKRVVAYASVSHMSLVVLGLFSGFSEGYVGSFYQMLGHGLVSGGLFFGVGVLYSRFGSRLIWYYSGVIRIMPLFSFFFFILICGNMGIPLTTGFVGEFLLLLSVFQFNYFISFFCGWGMVLGCVYSLWLYNRVVYGNMNQSLYSRLCVLPALDLTRLELFVLGLLSCFSVVFGIFPSVIFFGL